MDLEQQIIYADKEYKIFGAEQEFIIHPTAFGLLPIGKAALQSDFSCEMHIEDYHLILDSITLSDTRPEAEKRIHFDSCRVIFHGAILIVADQVGEYYLKGGKLACFSYQKVLELVFEKGILITTVDQSKAMQRIRKNLEMGLRSLNNNRDLRCIRRFMNSSFVGDYKPFRLNSMRIRYLKDMQRDYGNR